MKTFFQMNYLTHMSTLSKLFSVFPELKIPQKNVVLSFFCERIPQKMQSSSNRSEGAFNNVKTSFISRFQWNLENKSIVFCFMFWRTAIFQVFFVTEVFESYGQ